MCVAREEQSPVRLSVGSMTCNWLMTLCRMVRLVCVTIAFAIGVSSTYAEPQYDNLELGVPGECDQIVNREGYALGFSRAYKQPLWVVYRITKEEADAQTVSRRMANFYEDMEVEGSAALADYKGSGYDRGHLAPAGDMKISSKTMHESFSLANMSPQVNSFNSGIWNRLEEVVRGFARKEKSVFVVTGPIFIDDEEPVYIGSNSVRVPEFFYKVIYDETPPEKMIGFIIPNKGSKRKVAFYALPVDDVEEATGLDFFSELSDDIEADLESRIELLEWGLSQ